MQPLEEDAAIDRLDVAEATAPRGSDVMSARSPYSPSMPHSRESLFSAPPSSCDLLRHDALPLLDDVHGVGGVALAHDLHLGFEVDDLDRVGEAGQLALAIDEKKWFDLRNS